MNHLALIWSIEFLFFVFSHCHLSLFSLSIFVHSLSMSLRAHSSVSWSLHRLVHRIYLLLLTFHLWIWNVFLLFFHLFLFFIFLRADWLLQFIFLYPVASFVWCWINDSIVLFFFHTFRPFFGAELFFVWFNRITLFLRTRHFSHRDFFF